MRRFAVLGLVVLPLLLVRGAPAPGAADPAVEAALFDLDGADGWEIAAEWPDDDATSFPPGSVGNGVGVWGSQRPSTVPQIGAGSTPPFTNARPEIPPDQIQAMAEPPGAASTVDETADGNGIVAGVAPPEPAGAELFHLTTLQAPPTPRYRDGPAAAFSGTVNVLSGYLELSAQDIALASPGRPLVVSRAYSSYDAVAGTAGPFGPGWSWSYGTRAIANAGQSVTIVEGNGRRAVFTFSGGSYTAAPGVNATLAAAGGGGYTLTRHDQSVWRFDAAGKLLTIPTATPTRRPLAMTRSGGYRR